MTNHTEQTAAERAIREALAGGPTPGPWTAMSRGAYWHEEEADVNNADGEDVVAAEFIKPVGDVFTTRGQMYMRDASYIVACNPEAMTELLAEVDRLRAALATLTLPAAASSSTEPVADSRALAEAAYTAHAFNLPKDPVGSRDWTLYYAGWLHRGRVAAEAVPPASCAPAGFNDWFLSLPKGRQAALLEDSRWMLAEAAFDAGRASNAAEPAGGLQHVAVAEEGVLRWMSGRKLQNCELYAMPDAQAPAVPAGLSDAKDAERFAKAVRDGWVPLLREDTNRLAELLDAVAGCVVNRGEIAYQLTKRLVIDMPTARSAVDAALAASSAPPESQDAADAQKGQS